MKKLLFALFGAAFAFTVSVAQTGPARPGAPNSAAPTKAADEEEPKIEGTVLTRPNGTFLGLTLEEGKYKLSFYDQEKKPMKIDALRATARWPNPHGPGQNRTVLNPSADGMALVGAQFVRGPHSFRLFLTVVKSDDGQDVENYAVDFRG